jgi:hypothetical protein
LQSGFGKDMAGPYVQSLRDNYGIGVSTGVKERLQLPGAGELSLRWARPATTAVSS